MNTEKLETAEGYRLMEAEYDKKRICIKRIRPFYESELIKVLIGLRRSGKSVLLHEIMEELKQKGVRQEQIIYMNFEDFQYSYITNAKTLYDYICDQRKNEENTICFLMRSRW